MCSTSQSIRPMMGWHHAMLSDPEDSSISYSVTFTAMNDESPWRKGPAIIGRVYAWVSNSSRNVFPVHSNGGYEVYSHTYGVNGDKNYYEERVLD